MRLSGILLAHLFRSWVPDGSEHPLLEFQDSFKHKGKRQPLEDALETTAKEAGLIVKQGSMTNTKKLTILSADQSRIRAAVASVDAPKKSVEIHSKQKAVSSKGVPCSAAGVKRRP